ncbi:MAG: hypothetical protein H6810_08410 [Phycisphaeraceae bacterium]|nr:MAG: hypothetical protein H6810_08410 [Phycisphaeraceae bacterium]
MSTTEPQQATAGPETEQHPSPGPDDGGTAEAIEPVCPYCGEPQLRPNRCERCGAHTDPLSRQATQNEMGPWSIRDEAHPFRPGCRLETLERWARTGRIGPDTVVRGPTTNQHWTRAVRVPGLARILGSCHACLAPVEPDEVICRACGASLEAVRDRQHLGLSPVRPLPGRTSPGAVAASLVGAQPSGAGISPPPSPRPAPDPGPAADMSGRLSRLERRAKRAERRTMIVAVIALAFALLFAASVVLNRIEKREPAPEPTQPTLPALLDDDGAAVDHATDTAVTQPDIGAEEEPVAMPQSTADAAAVRTALLAKLESLVVNGSPESLADARQLLDTENGVLGSDDIAAWRHRIELAERAAERRLVP